MGFAFCLNLVAMLVLITDDGPHGWETVPFDFVDVCFTLLDGYRVWRGAGRVGLVFVSSRSASSSSGRGGRGGRPWRS